MPFGISVAGDVFQRKLDECFGHIKNLTIIADDIMVIGKSRNHKDHDVDFTLLLKTAKECNVMLNYQKLQYKCTEVNFYGENLHNRWLQTSTEQSHWYSSDGISKI